MAQEPFKAKYFSHDQIRRHVRRGRTDVLVRIRFAPAVRHHVKSAYYRDGMIGPGPYSQLVFSEYAGEEELFCDESAAELVAG